MDVRDVGVAVAAGVPALVLALFIGMWAVIAVAALGVVVGCAVLARTLASAVPARRPRAS